MTKAGLGIYDHYIRFAVDTGEIKKKKINRPRRTQAESTAKLVERDREHFILIKGTLHQEDIKF